MFCCLRCREVHYEDGYSLVVFRHVVDQRKPERAYALEYFCEACLHKAESQLEQILTAHAMSAAKDAKACKKVFLHTRKEDAQRAREEKDKW